MTNPPPPPPDFLDPTGHLSADLPCSHCGYNLRTRVSTDNCPECATPVAASIADALELFRLQPWLTSLYKGSLLVAACFLFVACTFALEFLGLNRYVTSSFGYVLTLVISTLLALGTWFLSAAPTPTTTAPRSWRQQNFCRPLFVAAWISWGVFIIFDALPQHRGTLSAYAGSCFFTLIVLALTFLLYHLQLLARQRRLRLLHLATRHFFFLTCIYTFFVVWLNFAIPLHRALRPINGRNSFLSNDTSLFDLFELAVSRYTTRLALPFLLLLAIAIVAWTFQLRRLLRATPRLHPAASPA